MQKLKDDNPDGNEISKQLTEAQNDEIDEKVSLVTGIAIDSAIKNATDKLDFLSKFEHVAS